MELSPIRYDVRRYLDQWMAKESVKHDSFRMTCPKMTKHCPGEDGNIRDKGASGTRDSYHLKLWILDTWLTLLAPCCPQPTCWGWGPLSACLSPEHVSYRGWVRWHQVRLTDLCYERKATMPKCMFNKDKVNHDLQGGNSPKWQELYTRK